MPSTVDALKHVPALLSEAEGIAYRPMMGEYLLYANGKPIGGVYDDRLLLKSTEPGRALLPDAKEEPPYIGARPMLRVESGDRALIAALVKATAQALPTPKKR